MPTDLPKGKSVKLKKTRDDGSFTLDDVEPGAYDVAAEVPWQIAPPDPGDDLGPARNKPCRADGYSVDNIFLQVGNFFVSASANSKSPLEVAPGEQITLHVEYRCRF